MHASSSSASSSETSAFSVLLGGISDPVNAWISADGLVEWINEDDFVEFESCILTNPIRVKDSQVSASASNTLFSD